MIVVDLPGQVVHQRWAPADGRYAELREAAFGDVVAAGTLPGISVETAALLDEAG